MTDTPRVTADDIPTSITKPTYRRTGKLIAAGLPVLSQNQTAEFLAMFWPEIEQHIRGQVADEIDAAADRTLVEYPDEPAMKARVIGQRAAARIARSTTTQEQ